LEPAAGPVDDTGVNEIRVIVQGDQTMLVGPLILVTFTVIVEFAASTAMISPTMKSAESPVHVICTIFIGAKLPTLFTFHTDTPNAEVLLLLATTPTKSDGEEEEREIGTADDDRFDDADTVDVDADAVDLDADAVDAVDAEPVDDDANGAGVPLLEETRLLIDMRVIDHGVQRIPVCPLIVVTLTVIVNATGSTAVICPTMLSVES